MLSRRVASSLFSKRLVYPVATTRIHARFAGSTGTPLDIDQPRSSVDATVPAFSETVIREEPTLRPVKDHRVNALKEAEKDLVVFKDISVAHILASKKRQEVATVSKTDTVYDAIKKMNEIKVGALVVVDNGIPVGMISERDYLNKVVLKGHSSKAITVNDIMTRDVVTILDSVTAGECMHMMTEGRFRHIPVVGADKKMIGIVSIGDMVKSVIDQQKETINYLRDYIERTY